MSRQTNVTVVAQPEVLDRGQFLQVSVALTSIFGASVVASRLYMEILDSQGRVVWPLSVVAKNTSEFTKLISTAELNVNTRYTIRVATNNKLIYQGFTEFKTTKITVPILLPLLVLPALLVPQGVQDYSFRIYRTELDRRVCPICRPNEGLKFAKDDPNFIRIGPPDLGGETHYNCRCHYDLIGVAFNAAVLKARQMFEAAFAIVAIKKHKALEVQN